MDPATSAAVAAILVAGLQATKSALELLLRMQHGEPVTPEEIQAKRAETDGLIARLEAAVVAGRPAEGERADPEAEGGEGGHEPDRDSGPTDGP